GGPSVPVVPANPDRTAAAGRPAYVTLIVVLAALGALAASPE
ncbi:MAG: hypothetical protein QOE27_883, partial [Solirubrobacteraceae bacterium]|nr:hypothetical protein [Solirubrobacteraceae bacterium]